MRLSEVMNQPIEHHTAEVSPGVELHYVEAGEGPLVVLLHGFPEFWYTWRHQIPALVEEGFRVVAPDLRGYNTSSKPEGIEAYTLEKLAGDIAQLILELGEERALVVGHDWGGVTAWELAMHHPERVQKLAVLNAPHPSVFARAILRPRQLVKSWYILAFQLPVLPELLLARDDWEVLREVFETTTYKIGILDEEEIEQTIRAFSQPGVATAAINYYRAGARLPRRRAQPVRAPVRIIWGRQDHALSEFLADPGSKYAPMRQGIFVEDAAHWVQNERPGRVNILLKEFFLEDD